MGASPKTNELLKNPFNNINFYKEKRKIGNVKISEIEEIHNKIVESVNFNLRKTE